jgi:predicted ABC-type ATPase
VTERVRQGGYAIPEQVIRRRFANGLANFHRHYKMAVSDWMLYDNSGPELILLQWSDQL